MKLYSYPLSGHVHRVRLFLSLLGLEHEVVHLDIFKAEHKTPAFLALNSFGQLPVLDDGGVVVSDSNAILVYLAKRQGRTDWLPEDAVAASGVQRWLSVAAGEIAHGPAAARAVAVFGRPGDPAELLTRAHRILGLMDGQLVGRSWIASTAAAPTIADVALYAYVAHAPEGHVDLSGYPNVNAWLRRVEALPGFVPMAAAPASLAA
jgi:glutathione S-transferase